MSDKSNSATPLRARRTGQKMTATEREYAKDKFLDAFAKTANILAACHASGIDRSTVYRWKEADDTFLIRFNLASEDANDRIRAELFRRGVQGYEKPMVSLGRAVYDNDGKMVTERVYSDNLLSLLAKSRMNEFREKQQIDVTQHSYVQEALLAQHMTSDELDEMSAIMERARVRKAEAESKTAGTKR